MCCMQRISLFDRKFEEANYFNPLTNAMISFAYMLEEFFKTETFILQMS